MDFKVNANINASVALKPMLGQVWHWSLCLGKCGTEAYAWV